MDVALPPAVAERTLVDALDRFARVFRGINGKFISSRFARPSVEKYPLAEDKYTRLIPFRPLFRGTDFKTEGTRVYVGLIFSPEIVNSRQSSFSASNDTYYYRRHVSIGCKIFSKLQLPLTRVFALHVEVNFLTFRSCYQRTVYLPTSRPCVSRVKRFAININRMSKLLKLYYPFEIAFRAAENISAVEKASITNFGNFVYVY